MNTRGRTRTAKARRREWGEGAIRWGKIAFRVWHGFQMAERLVHHVGPWVHWLWVLWR